MANNALLQAGQAMGQGLSFVTGVSFYSNILQVINAMTFIYDVNWKVDNSDVNTLPCCFFSVRSMREIMQSTVSTKQMMFYNSTILNTDSSTGGVMNVVADNIVIQPKQYQMDIVVPYSNLFLLTDQYYFDASTIETVTNRFSGSEVSSDLKKNVLSVYGNITEFIKNILKSVTNWDYDGVTGFAKSTMATPDYNKNSLEAMWRNRSILKMKTWQNWRYKYVVITDLTVQKDSAEDGVYEASMTVQEVPIMTLRSSASVVVKNIFSKAKGAIATASGKAMIAVLNGLEA